MMLKSTSKLILSLLLLIVLGCGKPERHEVPVIEQKPIVLSLHFSQDDLERDLAKLGFEFKTSYADEKDTSRRLRSADFGNAKIRIRFANDDVTEVNVMCREIDPKFTEVFVKLCEHVLHAKSNDLPQCESWLAIVNDLHVATLREFEKIRHESIGHLAPSEYRGTFSQGDLVYRKNDIIEKGFNIKFDPKSANIAADVK